jgi:hypothetical protein
MRKKMILKKWSFLTPCSFFLSFFLSFLFFLSSLTLEWLGFHKTGARVRDFKQPCCKVIIFTVTSLDFDMGDEMEWEYEEADDLDSFDDPSCVIGVTSRSDRLFSKTEEDDLTITPTNNEEENDVNRMSGN